MLPGQRVEDYAQVADRLAQTFGAQDCRVRSVRKRRHLVELWFLINDPLETVVRPFDAAEDALTAGIPVALAEDGTVFRLKLVGSHVLVCRRDRGREGVGAVGDHRRPGPVRPRPVW